jgi:sterol desaturase/sphingolipid hydroxylase (fatty acid hydroxylase superfamily)
MIENNSNLGNPDVIIGNLDEETQKLEALNFSDFKKRADELRSRIEKGNKIERNTILLFVLFTIVVILIDIGAVALIIMGSMCINDKAPLWCLDRGSSIGMMVAGILIFAISFFIAYCAKSWK